MKGISTIAAACLLVSGVVYALEFSDNFDDGNYYGWLEPMDLIGGTIWQVESGELHAYYEGVNFGGCQLYTPLGAVTDFDCQFISTRKTTGGSFTDGVVRISERDHYIVWQVVDNSMLMLAYNDGAGQQELFLESESVGSYYHTMRLKVEGSAPTLTITAWWDGQEKWSGDITVSEALAQGHVGLFASGDTASIWFDDVSLTYLELGIEENFSYTGSGIEVSPNPLFSTANVNFSLSEPCMTVLSIYDVSGRLINTLVNTELAGGDYSINVDTAGMIAGVYMVRLQAGENVSTGEFVILR